VISDEKNPERPVVKRFYQDVSHSQSSQGEADGAWQLLLDGRPVKTPGKNLVSVPDEELAKSIADEWRAQGEAIDPQSMPITRIINSAIDGVRGREAEVAADIAAFAGSDLLCYRAEAPVELVARQAAAWDPVLAWAAEDLGARFVQAQGVMPVAQPKEALEAYSRALGGLEALGLCALHVMTTLTGSAVLALAVARGEISAEAAWAAAHIDEDFQIEQWGEDAEAAIRREQRRLEFEAASLIWRCLS
jgi:chaperone required for assembly of F1-ATPase